jgi:hypothetical protein
MTDVRSARDVRKTTKRRGRLRFDWDHEDDDSSTHAYIHITPKAGRI